MAAIGVRKPVKRKGKVVGYRQKVNKTTTRNYNKKGQHTSTTIRHK